LALKNELFESCIDGIIKISSDMIILESNKAFSDMIGWDLSELIGQSFIEITPKPFHNKDHEVLLNLAANGFVEEYSKELLRKNGIRINVSIRFWTVYENNQIKPYFWAFIREKNTVENNQNLQISETGTFNIKYDQLFDNLPVGIAYISSDKCVKVVNKNYLEILQLEKSVLLNKPYDVIFSNESPVNKILLKDPISNKCYIDVVNKTAKPITVTREFYKKHLRISFIPLIHSQDNKVDVLMMIHDDTEIYELEKKLRQNQKMDSIGSLTGGIAHDFNNILTGIMGYAELLKLNLPKGHQSNEEIQGIILASNRAKELIRQLLTFSRQTETKTVVVNITTILKEIIRLLRGSLPSIIEIYTEYPPDTWNILADPAQLHQVLMNLCINAQQAMPNGGVLKILVHNVELDEEFCQKNIECKPGKYVCLIVEDSGIGMPEDVKNRIFEPFFTTKSTTGGTGLGLAIVYGIIKGMQGVIEFESEVNSGTKFRIYFPAVFEDVNEEIDADINLKGGNELILFVDDEVPIVDISTSILKNFGYKTLKAFNGIEALEVYKENKDSIDLIITDLTMPKMSGTTLAREILKINKDAKVILCSGYASSQIITDLKEVGIREFIPKPLIATSFLDTIRKVLDSN
jgi:PAS domain S-box-containing protein